MAGPLTPDEEPAAARLLAAAFREDPVARWMYPDDATYEARYTAMMTRMLRVTRARSRTLRTTGGCAIWIPPGQPPLTVAEQVRMVPAAARFHRPLRSLALLDRASRVHPHEPPHWYLFVVGSDPAQRGQGHGKAVIEPVLAECDTDGLPAYLESSNSENISFYERLGFVVTGEISRPGSPVMIPMWREPRSDR